MITEAKLGVAVMRGLWVSLGLAASVAADAQEIRPPVPHLPPPVPHTGPPAIVRIASQQTMTIWRVGTASCGGEAVAATRAPNPLPSVSWGLAGATAIRLAFRIDASGRAVSIRPDEPRYATSGGDVMPALAAAAFAPGVPRSDCSISFTAERMPLEQVPVALAMAYTVFPAAGPPQALWQRVRPADTTCFEPAPAPLNRAYPDFTAIAGEQGRPLWSMVGYDIDANGKPVHVRTIEGSRSAKLDAASRRAVEQSRFAKGARRGCLYPYWKIADPMPAPEPPSRESFPAQPDACKAIGEWARAPQLIYPANYRRRGIEGWAIVSYDVAPWGAVGNVKVIASEPTSDFGEAAAAMFTGLSRKPSEAGASGCIERVRYVMGKPGIQQPAQEVPRALY